jgi:hypothetical protein
MKDKVSRRRNAAGAGGDRSLRSFLQFVMSPNVVQVVDPNAAVRACLRASAGELITKLM